MNRPIAIFFLLATLLISSSVSSTTFNNASTEEITSQSSHIYEFNSNAELAAASTSGSGSAEDPYILDSSILQDTELIINGTDAYVSITGGSFTDLSTFDTEAISINITDASNILITQNEFDYTYNAIELVRVDNVNITDNDIVAYLLGITIGGSNNVNILRNTIESTAPIYFTHLERDYSFFSSIYPTSTSISIRDNSFDRGTIDVFFPLKYNEEGLFSYDIANNSQINSNAGITQKGSVIIAENLQELDLANSNIGLLILRNATEVDLSNTTLLGNIWLKNITSLYLHNVTTDNHIGYLSSGITIQKADFVSIKQSNFTAFTKHVISRFQSTYYQNVTNYPQFFERFMVNYISLDAVTSGEVQGSIINSTKYSSQQIGLVNSDNFLIDQNDFIFQSVTEAYNPIRFENSSQIDITRNNFYSVANDGTSDDWDVFITTENNTTFDDNYYSWYEGEDTDDDGYFDDPYLLYDAWWSPETYLYDENPRVHPFDIFNFTITEDPATEGLVDVVYNASVNRELSIHYDLYFANGSSLVSTPMKQMTLDTRLWHNATYNFQINATVFSSLYEYNATRSINFALDIANGPGSDQNINPEVEIDPIASYVNSSSIWLNLTLSSDVTSVKYLVNGGDLVEGKSSNLLDLEDGEHTIFVKVHDRYNNSANASISFIVDTILPEITVTSPMSYTEDEQVWLNITSSEILQYWSYAVNDSSFSNALTNNSVILHLEIGSYEIKLKAVDLAGNTGMQVFNLIIEETATETTTSTTVTDSSSSSSQSSTASSSSSSSTSTTTSSITSQTSATDETTNENSSEEDTSNNTLSLSIVYWFVLPAIYGKFSMKKKIRQMN